MQSYEVCNWPGILVSYIQIPPTDYVGFMKRKYRSDYCKLDLRGYSVATVTGATMHAVAAEYPHCTLTATPTCCSHRGTMLYEA